MPVSLAPKYAEQPAAIEPKGTYAFVSLGCPKNLVDSERMLGLLQIDGYELVDNPDGADFVVVNTCGFIERARTESFSAIDEMLELKKAGRTKGVIVSGCLAERQKEELLIERPGIDYLVGVFGREAITKVADRLVGNLEEQRSVFQPAPIRALPDTNRLRISRFRKGAIGCVLSAPSPRCAASMRPSQSKMSSPKPSNSPPMECKS
jgi:ribosomal protein S12 methylthiotransferase